MGRYTFDAARNVLLSVRPALLSAVTSSMLAACSTATVSDGMVSDPPAASMPTAPLPDPATLTQCAEAFEVWAVDGSEALNSDGDTIATMVAMEGLQRRVFELCSLPEAEQLNGDLLVDGRPMIEPDFRTFAEVECVDEGPLLEGTPLCAEMGE